MRERVKASSQHDKIISSLKDARIKAGLSHEKLAELAKISRRAVGMIESGERKPTLYTCLKICEALKVDINKIISDSREK